MNIMTKRGNLDNIVTYEHCCDVKSDLYKIPAEYATLGSIAVVIKDEDDQLGAYIATNEGEWVPILGGGSGGSSGGEEIKLYPLTVTENGIYIPDEGTGFSDVTVNCPVGTASNNDELSAKLKSDSYTEGFSFNTYANPDGGDPIVVFSESSIPLQITSLTMNVETVASEAFSKCIYLEEIILPITDYIADAAFMGCPLKNIVIPNATYLGYMCFGMNNKFKVLEAPSALTVDTLYLTGNILEAIVLPSVETISGMLCSNATAIHYVYLGANCSWVASNALFSIKNATIDCGFSEEKAQQLGAPWGAENCTFNYNVAEPSYVLNPEPEIIT